MNLAILPLCQDVQIDDNHISMDPIDQPQESRENALIQWELIDSGKDLPLESWAGLDDNDTPLASNLFLLGFFYYHAILTL